jgi:flagellar biosynthesis GTPase FlhF
MHVAETRKDCYGNYIITTNEDEPIREELGDRRIIYIRSKKVVDEDHFETFYSSIRPEEGGAFTQEFLSSLYRYMLNIDIKDFRPRCYIKKLMNNQDIKGKNSKLENQIDNLDPVGQWILEHHEFAIQGFTRKDVRNENDMCVIPDFAKYMKKYFTGTSGGERLNASQINKFFEEKGLAQHRRRISGTNKEHLYKLKTRDVEPGIHALIDYYKLKEEANDKEAREIEEEELKKIEEKEKEHLESWAKIRAEREEDERKKREWEENCLYSQGPSAELSRIRDERRERERRKEEERQRHEHYEELSRRVREANERKQREEEERKIHELSEELSRIRDEEERKLREEKEHLSHASGEEEEEYIKFDDPDVEGKI